MTQTKVLPYGPEAISAAAALIEAGFLVAVPTETVYGLAADATSDEAVARIFAAKQRPSFNPLIVHVQDVNQALGIARFSRKAFDLAIRFWPGPLTLVLPLGEGAPVSTLVTAGRPTVALRCPAHPAMRDLLNVSGRPLAAPSANPSGRISPTRAEHVEAGFRGVIPLIIDGGATAHGLESTILAVEGDEVRMLRPGPIHFDMEAGASDVIEAPGQMASHYAPSKPLRLDAGQAAADEWLIGFGAVDGDSNLSRSADLVEAAANLFARLHEADMGAKPKIAVAPIPAGALGAAINDRLRRAAAPRS